ncbi:juvenile hormone esterase-like [Diprion similis]|uniref:juvenile hormone esterase-like n=1 Tax=Diprion similis TaxID=362088 RepID=UPI001EF90A5C|nr:juvenile hormone esterase-like [Diprion similis]
MSSHVVKLRGLGSLRGIVERNVDGGSYLAFKGVPYAEPPIGRLRFSDPVPSKPWSGIRDAAKYGAPCAQYDFITRKIIGSDDCLYLNVYVPSNEERPQQGLPVMVWIHGGGFINGSGDKFLYGPDYIIKKNVIVVTVNYRLGVLGFLNLEHKVAPGNQGLKDQVLALQWVQEHVEAFGGDKNNVTIFGESAGAAAVHYLAISPLAQGLFHKAIAQSGTVFSPWASILQSPKNFAIRLLEYLGKPFPGERETVDFLKTVDCEKLIEAQTKIQTKQERAQMVLLFGPNVDEDVAEEPFLPDFVSSPDKAVVKVPLILGYTDREGILCADALNENTSANMNADFSWIIHPQVLAAMKRDMKLTPAYLKQAYFGDEPIQPKKSEMNFVKFCGDMQFVNGVHDLVKIQVRRNEQPTYLYRFSFDNGFSPLKTLLNVSHIPGACHGDEMSYLFYPHGLSNLGIEPPPAESKERLLIERLTQMWTDFAKTGIPVPAETELVKTSWKPVQKVNELHYLDINEELKSALNPDAAEQLIWNKLPNKL